MNAFQPEPLCLGDLIARVPGFGVDTPDDRLGPQDLDTTIFSGRRSEFAGKSILIATRGQVASARALIEIDGIAARLVICPPDFTPERLIAVADLAQVDAIVTDNPDHAFGSTRPIHVCGHPVPFQSETAIPRVVTEWVLPTSGTTGTPKLVIHELAGLTGAIQPASSAKPVWATFYDIRRYGGLQIFLRAALAGARLILTNPSEPIGDFLGRCGEAGVTHMTGTPSHWRRLLMGAYAGLVRPAYVRLSGEIADSAVLASLRSTFPQARIVHAYASTEAGVGFEVTDEREGFPASFIGGLPGVDLKIVDGSLRVRSSRTAKAYIGRPGAPLLDPDGFVDTDDLVEIIRDRCLFRGRRTGVINIGGLKVHPEEVESVINAHPGVRMSLVRARHNPIMGDIVVADLVLRDDTGGQTPALRNDILAHCRARLDRHKVPVTLKFVASLDLVAGGKLARYNA